MELKSRIIYLTRTKEYAKFKFCCSTPKWFCSGIRDYLMFFFSLLITYLQEFGRGCAQYRSRLPVVWKEIAGCV
jgi:hypothetical protein